MRVILFVTGRPSIQWTAFSAPSGFCGGWKVWLCLCWTLPAAGRRARSLIWATLLVRSSFIYSVFTPRVVLWKHASILFTSLSAGLDAAELASLRQSAFSFIRESCVPLIPPSNFAVSTETLNRITMSTSDLCHIYAKTQSELIHFPPPAVTLSSPAGGFWSRQRRAGYQQAASRSGRWATSSTWEGLHWFLRATDIKRRHVR